MSEVYDIAWSSRVAKDLQNIKAYFDENATEEISKKILKGIMSAVQPTALQPERYPLDPYLKKHGNFRFINKWNYRIVYEFTGHQIIVHRITYAKRNMKSVLKNVR
jgi:plasmid stabilization system protein ParE